MVMATNRDYTADFRHNVKVSLEAENIARELIEQLTLDNLVSVRDEPEFFHVGDLLNQDGQGYDVKDDGVIHRTKNVFCEVKKHWRSGETTDGWMLNGEYNYLCVLDRVKHNIYILDFPKLQKEYKKIGFPRYGINMGDNLTDGFVVSLKRCRKFGLMVCEGHYEYNENIDLFEIVA